MIAFSEFVFEIATLALPSGGGMNANKHAQWKALLGKNRLDAPELAQVVADVRHFMAGPLRMARERAKGK